MRRKPEGPRGVEGGGDFHSGGFHEREGIPPNGGENKRTQRCRASEKKRRDQYAAGSID
jgi:hypothetical protein